jgi:hypothetical protein
MIRCDDTMKLENLLSILNHIDFESLEIDKEAANESDEVYPSTGIYISLSLYHDGTPCLSIIRNGRVSMQGGYLLYDGNPKVTNG